ncbi:secretin N-terminal domain-containing protein [Candidatus Dependentiae bacterium]
MLLGLQQPFLLDGRRTDRRSSIAGAFQDSSAVSDDLLIKEDTIQVASVDKVSLTFEDSSKEISKSDREPTPVRNVISKPEPLTQVQQERKETLTKQDQNYELPEELQKKATQDLEKLQEMPAEEEKVELQFEDADLLTFVKQIADIFQVTFISDDAIDPLPKGSTEAPSRALKGNKISFKTNAPVTKQEAWNLFITFLNISGFSIVPQPDPTIYRIQTIKSAQRSPISTFIGVNFESLPESDELIRYLYFIENATIESMRNIIPSLQSTSATQPIWLSEQKAFILTDQSYNIRALMAIVKELDKVTMPQAMSVLKLKQADAVEVKKLYDDLTSQGGDQGAAFRPFGARKQPTAIYFPESAKIIAEPRTNSLILLGPKDAISKIEDFIIKHVDVALDQPYSPLYTYQLQYADSKTIAEIMNSTTKLGQNTEVGKAGGVRGKDKYLKPMNFTAEPSTNKLIIKADYQDYLMAKKVIDDLDQPQPQVAIDVLILSVRLIDDKELGVQLRSKVPGLDGILGQNVKFQTSGLRAGGTPGRIVTNNTGSGVDRLLGNLINLVTQAPAGNTIVTFGQDLYGVWGLFQALRTITNVQVISNPFLFASNKTPAKVSIGETRRVVSGTIQSGDVPVETFKDDSANLTVEITPQINSDGMIVLALTVNITEFTNPEDPNSARKTTRLVQTQAIVGDREVLALGGIVRSVTSSNVSKTPVLGDIPLVGWLFKNKNKAADKDSLLILMSTKIIPPHATSDVNEYTKERLGVYRSTMRDIEQSDSRQDPIQQLFFSDKNRSEADVGEFIFDRHQRSRRAEKKRRKENGKEAVAIDPSSPTLAQAQTRSPRRRRGRRRSAPQPEITPPMQQQPVTIAQSPTLTTIAAPTKTDTATTAPQQFQAKRRSRSLSSFLTPEESEKVA